MGIVDYIINTSKTMTDAKREAKPAEDDEVAAEPGKYKTSRFDLPSAFEKAGPVRKRERGKAWAQIMGALFGVWCMEGAWFAIFLILDIYVGETIHRVMFGLWLVCLIILIVLVVRANRARTEARRQYLRDESKRKEAAEALLEGTAIDLRARAEAAKDKWRAAGGLDKKVETGEAKKEETRL